MRKYEFHGRVQAQFHLVFRFELALRHRGIEFRLSELHRTRSREHCEQQQASQ
jgi:hypothetical protein